MGRLHTVAVTFAAIAGLIGGSVLGTGVAFAGPNDPLDPNWNTPGFPLTQGEEDDDSAITFGINDSTPAPFTLHNYGGIPLPGPNFVNLGDSYTTAAFYGTMLMEPCVRNAAGFAPLVGVQTGLPSPRDAACAGASLLNYWHTMKSFQFPVPKAAQRLAINNETKLVVASLGGNDTYSAALVTVLVECLASWVNPAERATGNPCERQMGPEMKPRINNLAPAIAYMLGDAKKRAADDAVIIAMGYFNPLPKATSGCWIDGIAPEGDLKFVYNIFANINRQVRIAAKMANVLYYNPSAEEDYTQSSCGLPFRRMISISGIPEANVPFHPTLAGHYDMSRHVVALYNRELNARKHGKSIAQETWKTSYNTRN